MANREYSLLFKINAALSDKFGAALKAAQNAMKGLQGTSKLMSGMMSGDFAKLQGKLRDLTSTSAKMRQFSDLQQQVGKSAEALNKGRADSARLNREYTEQVKQTQLMADAFKRLKQYYKDNKANMSAEDRAAVQGQIADAKEELKVQRLRERDAGKSASLQSAEVGKLQAQLERQQSALRAAQSALNAAGINASNFASEEARLRAEIERTTAALERQSQISANRQRFSQASQSLSDSYGNLQNSVDTAKTIMSPIKSAIDEAVTYEQNLSKLKALTQTKNIRAGDFETVNREMAELDATIKHLGATTEFTTIEAAGAAIKFAQSGWTKDQITGTLPGLINVATASGERDLVKLGDYMSDELQAMGLMKGSPQEIAKNVSHYSDLMTYALNQSNNDLESFHQAMKYFAPVGTQLGMKPEEMISAVMTQADAGIKGSMGGTAQRMASLRMFAPPKTAVKALQDIGEYSSDAQKGLAEASAEWAKLGVSEDAGWLDRMKALKEASKTMSKADFMAKLSKITGVNAVSGNAALFADFDKFTERLDFMQSEGVNNWANDVASTMRDNTATDFELFNSAVAGLSVTVGNLFLPALRQATQGLTQFVSNLDKFAQANPGIIQGVGAIAAGLSSLIVASAGAKMAMAGWEFISSGFLVLKDTITSAALAVASLPARLATAFAALRGMSFASMFAGLGASLLPVIGIAAAVAAAGYFIYQNWSSIAPLLSQIGSTISASLSTAFAALSPAVSNLITAVQRLAPVFSTIGAAIGGALLGAIAMIANFAATLITTFANAVSTIINLFAGLGNALASLLAMDFSKAGEYLKTALINAVQGAFDTIKSLVGGLFDTLTSPMKLANSFGKSSGEGSSGGGSFGAPTESTVQAQTVQVQAAEVQQQDTGIVQTLTETVTQLSAPLQTITQASEPAATSMQNFATSSEQASTSFQPVAEGFANLAAVIQPVSDGFTQLSASVQPVSESFTQISAGVTAFNTEITNTGAQLTAANAATTAFTASLTSTNGAITGFTGALTGGVGAVTGLGSAASGASGSISGLGSAASAACAALAAAGANAAAAVSAAAANASAGKVAANYRGGIYPKGEFITTFAEKSAEAAIPLDNSSRAISLWRRAGQILGVLPGNDKSFDTPPKYDKLGNIENLNGLAENIITEFDSMSVARAKKEAQLAEFNSKMKSIKPARSPQNIFSGKINLPTAPSFNPTQDISAPTSIFANSPTNIFSSIADTFSPTNILSNISDMIQSPANIFENILNPTETFPTADNIMNNSAPIDLHFEINIAGNANAEEVRAGIEQSIPMIRETFEEQMASYNHERQRVSFA